MVFPVSMVWSRVFAPRSCFMVRRFPEVSIDSRTIFLHFSFLSLTLAVLDIICYLSAKLIPVMMRRDRDEDDLYKMRVPNDQATS